MNGIEQIKSYYNKLPFSTVLLNKLTVDISRAIFEKVTVHPDVSQDARLENITSAKLQKYLAYYDYVQAIPEDDDDKSNTWTKGIFDLHKVFGGRELSVDEKNCYAVLVAALEDRYEKYDGSGYPKGKRRDEICHLAQILTISEFIAKRRLGCVAEATIVKELDKQSAVSFNPQFVEFANTAVTELFDKDREWFELYGSDEGGKIQMDYQPIIDCVTGTVFGYENRMVLNDPKLDAILPTVYVPVAEKSNRICDLVQLQLEKLCQRLSLARLDSDANVHPMWLNISVVCLKRKGFAATVKKVLSKYHIHPDNIVVAITETALGYEDPQIPLSVSALREMGIRIALDRFGAEYSSLSGLSNFDIDYIKLDAAFTDSICDNKKTFEIVKSISVLARNLNIEVLAVGIKTTEQKEMFTRLSCRYMQGDLFGLWNSL